VTEELKNAAVERHIELVILPTKAAIEVLKRDAEDTNAVLHVTC